MVSLLEGRQYVALGAGGLAALLAAHSRRPPVPPAEQGDGRRYEDRPHNEGVEKDSNGQPQPNRLDLSLRGSAAPCYREHREGSGQHQPGGSDGRPSSPNGLHDCSSDGQFPRLLSYSGHDENVVILAQGEEEYEHEEGQDEGETSLPADVYEDDHCQPEGRQI